jgi:hypothetical protein
LITELPISYWQFLIVLHRKSRYMKGFIFLVALLLPFYSFACPLCSSPSAREIRKSLFGPDLLFNLFVTVLPFFICAIITFLIYHGGLPKRKTISNHNNEH